MVTTSDLLFLLTYKYTKDDSQESEISLNKGEKSFSRNLTSTKYFSKENNLIHINFRNFCYGFSTCLGLKSSEECKHLTSIEINRTPDTA